MPSVISLRCRPPFVALPVEARLALSVRPLDFNALLIENRPARFVVKVAGDSMNGIGLCAGDFAIVNRARLVVDGFTLKRFC